jgi:hypothetical protein
LTKEEGLGKKPLHTLEKTRLGVTKMVVIALVVLIVVGGIAVAYIALQLPSPSQTPSPMPKMHTVDYTTMVSPGIDLWNITITNPYTIILNDSMTVSSGSQYLCLESYNSSSGLGEGIWRIEFINSTYFNYRTYISGMTHDSGNLGCASGIVKVIVNATAISFIGTSSFTSYQAFENLGQIKTFNNDGNFSGGELDLTLTKQ